MAGPAAETQDVLSFGPFKLAPSERLLTLDGVPVDLGARALDILIALVSHPNEIVSKRDLMARVWPDVTVEEGSLRFHIASLRKALGDGKDGARYITTLPGRGYCFVAPVFRSRDQRVGGDAITANFRLATLPARLARMVGREDCIRTLSTRLVASRFVTIVGTGGVGKTTVAVAVAHDLLATFDGAVLFVDFGMVSDPHLLPASLASMLGISIQSDDPIPSLVAFVRDKRMLITLDGCEHVIEAAARLVERIFLAAPQLHLLATSREPLRVEGEQVERLTPLSVPPDDPALTAAIALTFPATQLFVERATASGARVDFSDADATIVANICRKLDGVPLAIELAAGRVEAYGLQQTASLLDQRLTLLWSGKRTAPPRQRTLQATLDWSYALLSEPERMVFRRLGIFVGYFTVEAALEVVRSATVDQADVLDAIDSLVTKSMVAARPAGATMRYRLLDAARTYAREILIDDTEYAELAVRHATYCRRWLEQSSAEWPASSHTVERAPHLVGLNDVRAALEWCLGPEGETEIGIGLAAAAAPVFLSFSLLADCHRWAERAILAIGEHSLGSAEEMLLQAALGMALMFTRGYGEDVGSALTRGLKIAEERGDRLNQILLLSTLHQFRTRIGDYTTALRHAERVAALASTTDDPAAVALSHALLGSSLHLAGHLSNARLELNAALGHRKVHPIDDHLPPLAAPIVALALSAATNILARTLWLQGHSDQAVHLTRQFVEDATSANRPITFMGALIWASSLLLWIGDLDAAEEHINRLASHAEVHDLRLYIAVGQGFKARLAIQRGDAKGAVVRLEHGLEELKSARLQLMVPEFNISLARGLTAVGRVAEGYKIIDETIHAALADGDLVYMPELLRVKGEVLLSMPQPSSDTAETCLMQSMELSRRQGARAWELRAAVNLAALWAMQGRPAEAKALLQPVFEQLSEGRDTADLTAAKRLLSSLG